MALAVDAGDILAQTVTPIAPSETARELRERLIALGAQLLVETLPRFISNEITPIQQDSSLASYTKKIKKEDGLISLDAPAEENWKKYRAYADSIGTYFFSAGGGSASGGENGKRIKIIRASFTNGKFIPERVIPEGKREMDYVSR
jgi:methionyl-tRNA formyltransferase